MHPAEMNMEALLEVCDVRRQRRSGPGGQHRNKVETGVVLNHRPTGIQAEATERRSQYENRQVALMRLRVNLALAIRQPRSTEEGPSPRWKQRCHGGRFRASRDHEDYPALLAEALDLLEACQYDVQAAAHHLTITGSQLQRFLKAEPRAWELVNRRRDALGLRPLR